MLAASSGKWTPTVVLVEEWLSGTSCVCGVFNCFVTPTCNIARRHVVYLCCVFQLSLPPVLLDYYLSMADPSRAQTVDSDILYHCAYCLPAVAFTLGRRNWPYLSQLFGKLASSLQVSDTQSICHTHLRVTSDESEACS